MTSYWPTEDPVSSVGGWLMEVPVRAPGLPINLWIRFSGLDRSTTGSFTQDYGDWKRPPLTVGFPWLAADDTVLAGQVGGVALAHVWREETDVFHSDDWGASAADWVDPLQSPVVGPAVVVFNGQAAVRGRIAVVGVSATIDLLVLRPSLIPEVPPVHGVRAHRPKIPSGSISAMMEGPGGGIREALRAQLEGMQATLDTVDVDVPALRSPDAWSLAGPSMRWATVELSSHPISG